MHEIGFLLRPGFQMLDFAGPAAAFETANGELGTAVYRIAPVSFAGGPVTSGLGLALDTAPLRPPGPDTLVLVGGPVDPPLPVASARDLREAAGRTGRVAAVCIGAFALAESGLLDGRRATTHWRYATRLQQDHPAIRVEADRIFCRDGSVWTSAGITAGIDLALALIESDHGFAVAASVARHLVVHHRRRGGQSQFASVAETAPRGDRVAAALQHARDHIAERLPVERLAAAAHLSPRQFSRLFRAETGTSPARAVERIRADLARGRLEAGTAPVDRVAQEVGFTDGETMRRAFQRLYGMPPQAIRRAGRS